MKKAIAIIIFGLILVNISTTAFAAFTVPKSLWGKGSLKLTKRTADILEYYFSGGKKGRYAKKQKNILKPMFFVMSPNQRGIGYYMDPHGGNYDMSPNYVGKARTKCKKKSGGQECFVFAKGYTIVWQNGINNRRKLTKKEINAGKTLQILKETGFYGGSIAQTTISTIEDEDKKKAEKKRLKAVKKAEEKKLREKKIAEEKRLKAAKKAEKEKLRKEKNAEKKRLREEKRAAAKAAKDKAKAARDKVKHVIRSAKEKTKADSTETSMAKQLREVNELYQAGALTEEEYKEAKEQIINQ